METKSITSNNLIPKKYQRFVGTKKRFSGAIFSYKNPITEKEFDVLNIRYSEATIVNFKTKAKHPAFELLLKNESMSKARWTKPFPIREINFNKPNKS